MLITNRTMFENHPKCRIWILAFSITFCSIKIDLFQKLAKLINFGIFVHSKCKRSSLRSESHMRLFGRFSNTMALKALKRIEKLGVWLTKRVSMNRIWHMWWFTLPFHTWFLQHQLILNLQFTTYLFILIGSTGMKIFVNL